MFCKIDQTIRYYEDVHVDNIHFFDSTQRIYRELLLREQEIVCKVVNNVRNVIVFQYELMSLESCKYCVDSKKKNTEKNPKYQFVHINNVA